MGKLVGGVWSWLVPLGYFASPYDLPVAVKTEIKDEGGDVRIKAWLDGVLELEAVDSPRSINIGRLALGTTDWGTMRYDDVKVVEG
jgi:hypothetical protein